MRLRDLLKPRLLLLILAITSTNVSAQLNAPVTGNRAEQGAHEPKPSIAHRSSMRQFKDEDGTLSITNAPDKYRRREGFVEVNLRYTPVKEAPQYEEFTDSDDIAEALKECGCIPASEGKEQYVCTACATSIQTRLKALGYYNMDVDGIWGGGSKAALQSFKVAHLLSNDSNWDAQTKEAEVAPIFWTGG